MRISVDASRLKQWDLARIRQELRAIIRPTLRECPPFLFDEPLQVILTAKGFPEPLTIEQPVAHTDDITKSIQQFTGGLKARLGRFGRAARIPELAFLATVRPADFRRAYLRYDRHFKDGYSLAKIARSRRLGGDPDSVERDVKRISEAIHRKPYRARRRRLDAPGAGLKEYACRAHPAGSCPDDCRYMLQWWAKANRMLPTMGTGMTHRPAHRAGRWVRPSPTY